MKNPKIVLTITQGAIFGARLMNQIVSGHSIPHEGPFLILNFIFKI